MGDTMNPNIPIYGTAKPKASQIAYEVEPEVWDAAVTLSKVLVGVKDQRAINYMVATKLLSDKEHFIKTVFDYKGYANGIEIQKAWNIVNEHHNPLCKENMTYGFPSAVWNSAYAIAMLYAMPQNEGGIIRETNALLRSRDYFIEKTATLKMDMVIWRSCFYVVKSYHDKQVPDDDHFPGYERND